MNLKHLFHKHVWEHTYIPVFGKDSYHYYRHCHKCDKWQVYCGGVWNDCNSPFVIEEYKDDLDKLADYVSEKYK